MNGKAINLHVLAFSFYDSRTGQAIFNVSLTTLNVMVGEMCARKLLSVAIDGPANMVRRYSIRVL